MNYDKLFEEDFSYQIHLREVALLKDYLLKKQGWIYIAHSKNNHLLKIGRTGKNPLERAKTLSSTGVLHDYEILFSLKVFNQFLMEKKIHQKLKKYRITKEFFSLKEDIAIHALQEEYQNEKKALVRFLDIEIITEDLSLLAQAIKA